MKKMMLFLLIMIVPIIVMGQDGNRDEVFKNGIRQTALFNEWGKYLVDCNKLVPDTIKQSGVVNFEYKPVIFEGKVSHFNAVPIDTVWEKVKCNKYKNEIPEQYGVLSLSNGGYGWSTLESGLHSMTYSEPKQEKSVIKITRDKICMIKKQKSSWDDFWDRYCKEQNLVKFN